MIDTKPGRVPEHAGTPWIVDVPTSPDRNLAVTWPRLDGHRQAWLRDAVRRLYPDHPWLAGFTG